MCPQISLLCICQWQSPSLWLKKKKQTALNSEVTDKETQNVLPGAAFKNCIFLIQTCLTGQITKRTTNCILKTIHLECILCTLRRVQASVHMLCVAYVPSCRLACLAVIMLWPASHCEMSSWILKRLSLHLYLTIMEWHITWPWAL